MKIKFKLRTTILMLSQMVFLIALTNCGGGAGIADCEEVDLDVKGHAIEISEFFDQSKAFLEKITYFDKKTNKEVEFSIPQLDTIGSKEIVNLLEEYKKADSNKQKRIFGLRIFYTFDSLHKKIKLYYTPDSTSMFIDDGKDEYNFKFTNRYDSLLNCIEKEIPIYEVYKGKFIDVSKDQIKLEQAVENWKNYKSLIRFDRYEPLGFSRPFKIEKDAYSVFFPEDEFKAIYEANPNSSELYMVSGVRPIQLTYRHSINFGTIHPPVNNINKQLRDDEISKFVGRAGNLGQLCPSNCLSFTVKRIKDCTFKIPED